MPAGGGQEAGRIAACDHGRQSHLEMFQFAFDDQVGGIVRVHGRLTVIFETEVIGWGKSLKAETSVSGLGPYAR